MKVAFVIPWYGDIPGGAENECRRTAENLSSSGIEVEVLTTCAKEFLSDWSKDFYDEGIYNINGIVIRRFKLRQRNADLFNKINYKLMNNIKVSRLEEEHFITEIVNSNNLYKYISKYRSEYDYFIFIPYMFGTTYFGSLICPEKSIIIPCLHDESYAYMSVYKVMFESARGLIFLSEEELKLAEKLFDLNNMNYSVVGGGIDTNISSDAARFRSKYGITNKFMLYAGRKELGKKVSLLIDHFCKYKKERENDLKLILIGGGSIEIPTEYKKDILDLGFVPIQDKYDAYAAATLLCQPSTNESFSIVIMESWLCNTPVMVNADCAVTKDFCLKSNGGLFFGNYKEFRECVDFYLVHPRIAEKMGQMGRQYVLNNFSWSVIINKYKNIFVEWGDSSAN
jgi:glycosyltransferase involved in cell wall biosynthesis